MRYIFSILFCLILQTGFSQIVKTVGISYTNGTPTYTPAKAGSALALDTVTWRYYTWNGSTWLSDGFRVQTISGCSAPAYTPAKFQSLFVINACTVMQGGPELYFWTGSAWLQINEAVTVSEPALQVVKGTGSSVTSNANFVANDTSVAIRNNSTGLFAGLLKIGSSSIANKAGDFVFDVFSTSNYRNYKVLTDSGYVDNVNSSARPHIFTGEINKYRLKLENSGRATFGDDNTSADIILNAGTLKKKWSILTGSTPNPVGGGTDESIGIGMNIPGAPGYNSAYNSLIIDMETDYEDASNEYDEYYMTWIRAATGLYYRTALMGFFETGGVPRIENAYVGSFNIRPTTHLANFSSTAITADFQENRNILFGGDPLYNFRKFEVHSDAAGESTMFIGSNNQNPALGFGNLVGVNEPDYAVIEMQNIAAGAGVESGRFNFKTRNAGTIATRFSMLEGGGFQVVNQSGVGNGLVGVDATGTQYRTALDPATVTDGLLPSGTNGQILSHNGTTWVGATKISGTLNYVPKWTPDGTTLGLSQIFDNGTGVGVGTVSPSSKMHLYTTAAGSGSNGLFVQQNDATAGISHTSKFTTEQRGGGAGRTLFYAASPNTGTTNGQFDILTENGGAYIMALGPQISGGTNALSLYNNAGTVEANRLSSSGPSWLNGGSVGVGTVSANASAKVDIVSTTQGFLPPRMTTAQRNAIGSPATGLTLYCTDCTATDASTGVMQTYNGATWKSNW